MNHFSNSPGGFQRVGQVWPKSYSAYICFDSKNHIIKDFVRLNVITVKLFVNHYRNYSNFGLIVRFYLVF